MSLTLKTIAATILIMSVCCAQRKPSSVKPFKQYRQSRDMFFVGKVRSIEDFNLNHDPGDSGYTQRCMQEYYKFDKVGNLVERGSYGKDGKMNSRCVFRYDGAGNFIEWKCFEADSSCSGKHTYEFDKNGNMIKELEYRGADTLINDQQLYYDEYGSMVELCTSSEHFHINNTYVYDSLHQPVTKERIDVHKGISRYTKQLQVITYKYRVTYKYNDETREETLYDLNYNGYTTTVYNKKNRMLRWYGIDNFSKKPFNDTYKYDASGINVIEYKKSNDGILNDRISYSCKYVYDKKGNWIKRTTTTLDGKTTCSVERKVEYY